MNTRLTPQSQSRQASFSPYLIQSPYNGCLPCDIPLSKTTHLPTRNEIIDAFEMQTLASQHSTLEAFDELEHLVLDVIPDRITIAEISSLLYDQDDMSMEISTSRKSTIV